MAKAGPEPYWVDGWLLASLTDWRWPWSGPITLPDLLDSAEAHFRGSATFDDVSYSLPRLIAAGLITVGRDGKGILRFRATRKAFDLKARYRDKTPPIAYMIRAVGAAPRLDEVAEDRNLGRFLDLDYAEWHAAEVRAGLA